MIGIDISDFSIKMAQLSNGKNPSLISYCVKQLPGQVVENGVVVRPDVMQQYLRAVLQECRLPEKISDAVIVSIPETQSFLRVVEMPAIMSEDEISEAIQWEVAQHIPFGLENVYIDWQPLEVGGHMSAGGKREVQVGAAQKKVIDSLYEAIKPFKFDVAAFELESQAIIRALISKQLRNKQGLLVIDLGASATNIVIHDHGAMRFTASLQKGAVNITSVLPGADAEFVNTQLFKLSKEQRKEMIPKLLPGMEELVIEVRGIVEFYNSIDAQHEVKEIIITGGGSNLPGLDQAFIKYFDNVHVQRGNPWVNILGVKEASRPPLDLPASVRFTTALGLALRQVLI